MYINLQLRTEVLASYDLEQIEGTIGNSKNACIILKSKTVHSEHAKLTRVKKGVIITPFSEDTKVYVNADLIESSHILEENDIINIGPYSLIVQYERENITTTKNLLTYLKKLINLQ